MKTKYLYILLALVSLSGCKKFLEIKPKNVFIPTTLSDYENMLNAPTVNLLGDYSVDLQTDDAFLPETAPGSLYIKEPLTGKEIYTFQKNIFGQGDNDVLWSEGYKRLFYFNTVINNVMTSTEGTDSAKSSVRAEALLGRAIEHLTLVNAYAEHYDPATAATEPGIPIVLDADVNAKHARNTVKEVYDQILADINAAIPNLPVQHTLTKFRACKAGGYALLSRVYLFMGDYTNSSKNADLTLNLQNTLVNMNNYKVIIPGPFPYTPGAPLGWTNIPDGQYNVETIVARTFLRPFGLGMFVCASPDLTALFTNNDMRWTLYYANGWPPAPPYDYMSLYGVKIYLRGDYYNNCLGVPEVYLNRAECRARANDLTGALADINLLRVNRIAPAAYKAFAPSDFNNDPLQVLTFVLQERRRELAFTEMRSIDLKRLNKDTRFQTTVTHTISGTAYVLPPNSPNYLRQIWPAASVFNPSWTLNP